MSIAKSVEEAVARSAVKLREVVAAGRKLDCHVGAMAVALQPSGALGGAGMALGKSPE